MSGLHDAASQCEITSQQSQRVESLSHALSLVSATKSALSEVLEFPPHLQELALRVLHQQYEARVLELKLALASVPASSQAHVAPPVTPNNATGTHPMSRALCPQAHQVNAASLQQQIQSRVVASGGGAAFSDPDQVKATLMALNPQWDGTPEELLSAMKAHMAGAPVTLARRGPAPPDPTSPSSVVTRLPHEGFKKVCHTQTHVLEIDQTDDATGKTSTRKVPVIQIYADPPVWVLSEFMSQQETDNVLSLIRDLPWDHHVVRWPRRKNEMMDRFARRMAIALQVPFGKLEDLLMARFTPETANVQECLPHLGENKDRSTLTVFLNEGQTNTAADDPNNEESVRGGEIDFVHLGFQYPLESLIARNGRRVSSTQHCRRQKEELRYS